MYRKPRHSGVYKLIDRLKRLFKREPEEPEDPYALVGAPKKPRPSLNHAAARAELD